jgi:hypothetical protein
MKKIGILFFALLAGCTVMRKEETVVQAEPTVIKEKVYVQTPLPLPIRPVWPKIKGSDMRCLSPTTQWELKNRDTMMKEYISQLEEIIKSTQ